MFDLIIYHHESLSEHRMKYIGGDIMEIQQLDADKFASWDITNVLEWYLGYRMTYRQCTTSTTIKATKIYTV